MLRQNQPCDGYFKSYGANFIFQNFFVQNNDGLVLPDKASLYLTAIEDAEYKDDKIECEVTYLLYD